VDALHGDDANAGTKDKPWRSINASLPKLSAGDTLCLRGGSYYERVYCAIAGTAERPIIIRSHPMRSRSLTAVCRSSNAIRPVPGSQSPMELQGSTVRLAFTRTSAMSWVCSAIRMSACRRTGIGWICRPRTNCGFPTRPQFIDPIYCGPGLWYDKQTGRIHARLAHTKLKLPEGSTHQLVQYQGETDPRKLPLVVAPYDATPLMVDQAMYVRFEDLVFRGGGRTTVSLMFGVGIRFDRCTIYAGNYAISSKGTGPLTMTHCGVFGMIAPWFWRSESSLYAYSGRVYPPFVGEAAEPERTGVTNPGAEASRAAHLAAADSRPRHH